MYTTITITQNKYENKIKKLLILQPCTKESLEDNSQFFDSINEIFEYCTSKFIINFNMHTFRRPLTKKKHNHFLNIYQKINKKYATTNLPIKNTKTHNLKNMITIITQSPKFLYQIKLKNENNNLTT